MHCEDCKHFERLEEEDSTYGACKLLREVLAYDNAPMWHMKTIIIQSSFGCILHKGETK